MPRFYVKTKCRRQASWAGQCCCPRRSAHWRAIRYNSLFRRFRGAKPIEQRQLPQAPKSAHRAFASFANRDFRIYFFSATTAMMADNIERVIAAGLFLVVAAMFFSPHLRRA
jgi:hypothetical protein